MIRTLLIIGMLLFSVQCNAHNCEKTDRCKTIKEQIRKVESRMRQGYSAAQGIRLDERLRTLREKRRKACR